MTSLHAIESAAHALAAADPALADVIRRSGPYEARPPQGDPFASLVRAIVYQQLAGAAASAIHGRVIAAIGGTLSPQTILDTSPEILRGAGLSTAKTAALIDLAQKSTDGTVPLTELGGLDDEEIIQRISGVKGIGRWTVEMFLMFELQRPDVWPVDDYGVRKGYTLMHQLPDVIKPRELRAAGEIYRPHRSLAAWYCWQAVRLERGTLIVPD